MIYFKNGGRLLTALSELPLEPTRGVKRLFMDFETTSGDRRVSAFDPWAGHRIAGIALTWDDHPHSYYVPIRHKVLYGNLPLEGVLPWLRDCLRGAQVWSNPNVKFDAHFAKADGAEFGGGLFDTTNAAKMVDSDRGFGGGGYGLDALSSDWLDEDIDRHDQRVQAYLKGMRPESKDYGDVPVDILGEYACQDVLTGRKLDLHCLAERERHVRETPRAELVWRTEELLTPVLWDMEDRGLRVDTQELKVKEFLLTTEILRLQEELHKLCDYPVEPHLSDDCHEVLCNRLGLPVLAWTDGGEKEVPKPSFDKDAMKSYLSHPDVVDNERYRTIVEKIALCRKRHTVLSLFVRPFRALQDSRGFVHPKYNQLIRTGRMSCSKPNSQQQNTESKCLIHPDSSDDALFCADASQIEFRLIGHYCEDEAVVDAYRRDPDTDFHKWVASQVFEMPIEQVVKAQRDPAKTVNFTIGYGGGKGRVLAGLSSNMQLVGQLQAVVDRLVSEGKVHPDQRREAFKVLCTARATDVYNRYHATLPGLRRITKHAANLVKTTGYVMNAMGRRRHLPERAAWRAFNSVTQGLASDLIKAGMVALSPRYCKFTRDRGIDVRINVHDEVAFHGRREAFDEQTCGALVRRLEQTPVPLRIPLRFGSELAVRSWGEKAEVTLQKDRSVYADVDEQK